MVALCLVGATSVTERCPGCDCPKKFCFTPNCDCRMPLSAEWSQEMVRQLLDRLSTSFNRPLDAVFLPVPPSTSPTPPPENDTEEEEEEAPAAPSPPPPLFGLRAVPKVMVVAPPNLARFGSDQVLGYYGNGRIYLSSELSRRVAICVLGHEIGHAWQAENHPRWQKVEPFLAEGFAEWMAYRSLRCYGDGASAYRIRSGQDMVYGAGLRYFLELERQGGAPLVFEVARTWLDLKGNRVPSPSKTHKDSEE